MQGITPNLCFNENAEESAHFYCSVFKNSKIREIARYGKAGAAASGMPEGTVMTVTFELAEQEVIGLNGGPQFTFTPANSFFVVCETEEEIDEGQVPMFL